MSTARDRLYRRHRFPPEIISYAVWLYFRFPLSLRMVEEMLAARGIGVSYETVRQWAHKFGRTFSGRIRQHAPARGDKWHLDEVVISIAGADSDDAGHAFQQEAGHRFRFEAGRDSDLMSATWHLLPRIDVMMFCPERLVKRAWIWISAKARVAVDNGGRRALSIAP